MAVLMALAVVLIWPPVSSEAASSYVHAASPASHSHHAHAEEKSHQRVLHVTLDADCHASAIGCCAMTHCHPGISVDPHEMTAIAANQETTAATAVRRPAWTSIISVARSGLCDTSSRGMTRALG